MITKLCKMIKRHAAYKTTYNQLYSLSNRELSDIGVSRCDIHRIASNHAKSHD